MKKVVNFIRDEKGILEQAEIEEGVDKTPSQLESILSGLMAELNIQNEAESAEVRRKQLLVVLVQGRRKILQRLKSWELLKAEAAQVFALQKKLIDEDTLRIKKNMAAERETLSLLDQSIEKIQDPLTVKLISKGMGQQ